MKKVFFIQEKWSGIASPEFLVFSWMRICFLDEDLPNEKGLFYPGKVTRNGLSGIPRLFLDEEIPKQASGIPRPRKRRGFVRVLLCTDVLAE